MGLEDKNRTTVCLAWCKSQREKYRDGLHDLYLPGYDALCAAFEETFWAPTWGVRTFKEQALIYAQGRTKPGAIVTNALPGDSAHNWGCASDWAEFRPDFKAKDPWEKADWVLFAASVEKAGLRWGGDWNGNKKKDPNDWDLAHAELPIRVRWKAIGDVYRAKGIDAAMGEIVAAFKGAK